MTPIPALPALTLIARLTVLIGAPVDAGPVPGGHRRIIPITGGTADGPRIEGEVLPIGADWNLVRPDGYAEVCARYLVRTTDGAVLTIHNEGLLRLDGVRHGITTPRVEAPADGPHAWLNDAVLVGTLTPADGVPGVSLEFHHAA